MKTTRPSSRRPTARRRRWTKTCYAGSKQAKHADGPGARLHRDGPLATYVPGTALPTDRLRYQRMLLDELLVKDPKTSKKADLPPSSQPAPQAPERPPPGSRWAWAARDGVSSMQTRSSCGCLVVVWDGRFDSVFTHKLADGYSIMPNEVSTLVHNESADLANKLIERCLEAQENVVIEGLCLGRPPKPLPGMARTQRLQHCDCARHRSAPRSRPQARLHPLGRGPNSNDQQNTHWRRQIYTPRRHHHPLRFRGWFLKMQPQRRRFLQPPRRSGIRRPRTHRENQ